MVFPRWYPSTTLLPDGRIHIMGGTQVGVPGCEHVNHKNGTQCHVEMHACVREYMNVVYAGHNAAGCMLVTAGPHVTRLAAEHTARSVCTL